MKVEMNIPQIMGLRLTSPFQERKQQQNITSSFGLTMASPLSKDTVSFRATPKELQSRAFGVSLDTARRVHKAALPMQTKVKDFMFSTFGDLVVTDLKPKNLIYKLMDRAKSASSIEEKSATRQLNSKSECLTFMTDLNGAKIVMRDGSKKSVEKVLKRLIDKIKDGTVELLEIENKRPIVTEGFKRKKKEQYDYASIDFLENMARIQEDKWSILSLKEDRHVRMDHNDITKANYSAIHFLLKLPGEERPFELMVMGKDVNAYKELDDKLFKILDNKNVDKKYQPLIDLIKPLNEPGNKDLKDKFNKYRGDTFIFQREKDPSTYYARNTVEYFLPLKYDLPPQYDMNNLYRIMLECEGKA